MEGTQLALATLQRIRDQGGDARSAAAILQAALDQPAARSPGFALVLGDFLSGSLAGAVPDLVTLGG